MTRKIPILAAALVITLGGGTGCSGGGSSALVPPTSGGTAEEASSSRAATSAKNATISSTICMAGASYSIAQDDEFSTDATLSSTPAVISAAQSAFWSTQFTFGRTNNAGIDDVYYSDASVFPNVNPFALGGQLSITARPMPSADIGNAAVQGRNWTSGVLTGHPLTYGYVEVSAEMPNLQGFWPAPIWLLGANGANGQGNGYAELDGSEIFGNSLPVSTVQQTAIYNAAHTGSDFGRTSVSPNPGTSFHTYGILWTPKYVSFYIDRKQTTPQYPNPATGPMNAIINLQVFTNHAWAPGPAGTASQTMKLKYYRWYQTVGAPCGSATPTPAPSPVPTAPPKPIPTYTSASTPSPEAIRIVQSSGQATSSSWGYVSAKFATMPQNGDLLVAVGELVTDLSPITAGWNELSGTGGYLHVFTGVVGSNGLTQSAAYTLGATAGGIIDVFDVVGASSTVRPSISSDSPAYQPSFTRSLTIPAAGGLTLTMTGAAYWQGHSAVAIAQQLPAGQADTTLLIDLNGLKEGGGTYSLRATKLTTEAYRASQPFSAVVTETGSGGSPTGDGDILWIPPAGR